MRVLHINTEKTQRGGERQTLILMRSLRDAGIETALVSKKGFPLSTISKEEGFETIEVVSGRGAIETLLSRAKSYDLIHSHAAKAQAQAAISKLITGKPHVYTRRVVFMPGSSMLTGLKYRLTDRVVCVSEAVKGVLKDFGIKEEKLTVIYDAVPEKKSLDRKRAAALLDELGVPAGKKIIGNIAALTPEKDHKTLILAAREIEDAVFLIFGDGRLREGLKQLINELGLGKRIFLAGFKDEVEDFFSVFDAFIISSSEEGLANVVLDSFLYGVPVVCTSAGGLSEVVINGKTGLLVPVRDHRALAEKISLVLNDTGTSERLRTNASSFIREKFSLFEMTAKYIEVYEMVLRGNSEG